MSILLKDVSMPRNCCDCPCSRFDDGLDELHCMALLEPVDDPQTRPTWCPLVEVNDAWFSHHPQGNIYASDEIKRLKEENHKLRLERDFPKPR